MKLYSYFRSSASWRVRIALALKGVAVDYGYVHMLRGGGEHHQPEYVAVNPMKLVPALETDDGLLTQSIAICEYLEELYPDPPLLPRTLAERAYVRSIAATIACEIHSLNNLRVLSYVTGPLGGDDAAKLAWYQHWIAEGLAGVEGLVARSGRAGVFCCGDEPGMADLFLVPQIANARRFNCPLDNYPTLVAIDARASALLAFQRAAPAAQGDAEA